MNLFTSPRKRKALAAARAAEADVADRYQPSASYLVALIRERDAERFAAATARARIGQLEHRVEKEARVSAALRGELRDVRAELDHITDRPPTALERDPWAYDELVKRTTAVRDLCARFIDRPEQHVHAWDLARDLAAVLDGEEPGEHPAPVVAPVQVRGSEAA